MKGGGGGGGSKCDVIKRGGGGGGGEDYCDGSVTEGGEGVQNSLNLCDVIYERPLRHASLIERFQEVCFVA